MRFLFKKFDEKVQLPVKAEGHEADFCYDCFAVSEEEIAPNVWKYGLGFGLQPINDFDGCNIRCISIRSRSSIWKTGMILSNSIATIDEIFTGELSAVFYHVMPNMPRYKIGDRICQIHLDRTESIEFIESAELRKTTRNENGYGSTGLR